MRNLETAVSRSLKQTEQGTRATIDGTLTVSEPGTVSINATAIGEAAAIARDALVVAFAAAVAAVEGDADALALAVVEANAFGLAVARALADTFVSVSSSSAGAIVCVTASAEAEATATAVAQVIVEVSTAPPFQSPPAHAFRSRSSRKHRMTSTLLRLSLPFSRLQKRRSAHTPSP